MTAAPINDLWPRHLCVAPMAGGPTTVDLVATASTAGAFAFVAGAYKPAAALAADIDAVTAVVGGPFGVNVFVPGRPTADGEGVLRHLRALEEEAAALGVDLGEARWDDDDWAAKVEVLLDTAPSVASFTFGLPPARVVKALQHRGSLVMITVTNVDEADRAVQAGADVLCAQGIEAGGHRGAFEDTAAGEEMGTLVLVRAIRSRQRIPVVAAGGIATPADVRAALGAGAVAAQAGTAFLLADEAGTHPAQRAALSDTRFASTAFTRAFTGRRARGLVNGLMQRHPAAPSAFPEIHHATRPLRAAAAAAGDPDRLHLWAGTGHRHAKSAGAADIVEWLTAELRA